MAPGPALTRVIDAVMQHQSPFMDWSWEEVTCYGLMTESLSGNCPVHTGATVPRGMPLLERQPASEDWLTWGHKGLAPFSLLLDVLWGHLTPGLPIRSAYPSLVNALQFNFSICLILLPQLPHRDWSQQHSPANLHPNLHLNPFPAEPNLDYPPLKKPNQRKDLRRTIYIVWLSVKKQINSNQTQLNFLH